MALAEWMTTGEPGNTLKADFAELDVRRFHPTHTADHNWCTSRALEEYGKEEEYGVHWPTEEFSEDEAGRGERFPLFSLNFPRLSSILVHFPANILDFTELRLLRGAAFSVARAHRCSGCGLPINVKILQ